MEKLIEDLILRLEIERTQCFRQIDQFSFDESDSFKNIYTGKIFAYDLCIEELKRVLDFEHISKSKR